MIRALLFDLSDVLVVGLTGIGARLQAILPYPADEILRQLRGDAMLDFLLGYCSEEEYLGRVKREVVRQIGVPAAECLFVDDRPGFLAAASQVGLAGIRFESSEQLRSRLAEYSIALGG